MAWLKGASEAPPHSTVLIGKWSGGASNCLPEHTAKGNENILNNCTSTPKCFSLALQELMFEVSLHFQS